MRYRKKPVVIEAEIIDETGEVVSQWLRPQDVTFKRNDDGSFEIKTLEGTMRGEIGDYIIKGVKGEFYPCKPDIFVQTYEPVMEGSG